jgi:hypothetical protein
MKMLPLKLDGGTNSGKQGISLGPSLFPDARLVHCVFGVFLGLHEGSASASDFILYDKLHGINGSERSRKAVGPFLFRTV